MSTDKNKIPFKHAASLRVLRIEREELNKALGTIKRQINHMQYLRMNEPDDFVYFSYESQYGGGVAKLTKRQTFWKECLKDVEESILLLKEDGQRDHERKFQLARIREAILTEGSYNCAYGC